MTSNDQSMIEVTAIERLDPDDGTYLFPVFVGNMPASKAKEYMAKFVETMRGEGGAKGKGIFFTMSRSSIKNDESCPLFLFEEERSPTYVVWTRRGNLRPDKFKAEAEKLLPILRKQLYG